MGLKNKRILISAGPTWVAIDKARVISNISTGETGLILANSLGDLGAKVTLLLGNNRPCCQNKNIKIIPFSYFDELKKLLFGQLKVGRFDALLHSAAVSDYRPKAVFRYKIPSGIKNLRLALCPAEKLINSVKRIYPRIFLVGFKFGPEMRLAGLFDEAFRLKKASLADLVVANRMVNAKYEAYIFTPNTLVGPYINKDQMANNLVKVLKVLL